MRINGVKVSPVEDRHEDKGISNQKPGNQGSQSYQGEESKKKSKRSAITLIVVMLLVVALILAGLVFLTFKKHTSGSVPMNTNTSQVKGTGKHLNDKGSLGDDEASGGVLSNKIPVKGVSVEDDSLGYNISVVSYIPGYKASNGSTVVLVEYMAKPVGSVYSLVDTSALQLKVNGKVISSSSDYNMDMSKLNLDVFESTESNTEVDGWLAYPVDGEPTGITFFYDRGTVSVDASSDSEGIVKPEMKKEIPLPSGK